MIKCKANDCHGINAASPGVDRTTLELRARMTEDDAKGIEGLEVDGPKGLAGRPKASRGRFRHLPAESGRCQR